MGTSAQKATSITATFAPITPAALAKLYKKHGLDGWKIKSSSGYESGSTTLSPLEFLEGEEQSVAGTVMRERGKKLGPSFSLDNLLVMVEEENEKPGNVIPEEYRGQRYFPADGTVLLGEDDHEFLAYAYWHDDRWIVYVYRLEHDWHSLARLLRPASK